VKIILAILAIFALGLLGLVVVSSMELRASNTLLTKCALLRPGMDLNTVTNKLGPLMYEKTAIGDIMDFGSVKDESFCRDKKLFVFYASTPPCRALEVYTDTNNLVAYVTWQGL
jgi:hypothetical protein